MLQLDRGEVAGEIGEAAGPGLAELGAWRRGRRLRSFLSPAQEKDDADTIPGPQLRSVQNQPSIRLHGSCFFNGDHTFTIVVRFYPGRQPLASIIPRESDLEGNRQLETARAVAGDEDQALAGTHPVVATAARPGRHRHTDEHVLEHG